MRQHRIIKQWVREAIAEVKAKNRQRFNDRYDGSMSRPPHEPSPYAEWLQKRWCYPVTSPEGKDIVLEVRGEQLVTDLATLPDFCYDATLSMPQVFEAISKERERQDFIWGPNKPQSLPGFLIVLEKELAEAKEAWVKSVTGDHAPLNEIVQIAATAVACLEKYGVTGSAIATNDIPEDHS